MDSQFLCRFCRRSFGERTDLQTHLSKYHIKRTVAKSNVSQCCDGMSCVSLYALCTSQNIINAYLCSDKTEESDMESQPLSINSSNNSKDMSSEISDSNQNRKRKRNEFEYEDSGDESEFEDRDELTDFLILMASENILRCDKAFETEFGEYEPPNKKHKARNGNILCIDHEMSDLHRFVLNEEMRGIGIDPNNIFNDMPNSICGSLEAMIIDGSKHTNTNNKCEISDGESDEIIELIDICNSDESENENESFMNGMNSAQFTENESTNDGNTQSKSEWNALLNGYSQNKNESKVIKNKKVRNKPSINERKHKQSINEWNALLNGDRNRNKPMKIKNKPKQRVTDTNNNLCETCHTYEVNKPNTQCQSCESNKLGMPFCNNCDARLSHLEYTKWAKQCNADMNNENDIEELLQCVVLCQACFENCGEFL